MPATIEQMADLKRAYDALKAKGPKYDTLFAYYTGNQPLVYSTERLREIFGRLTTGFTQNWCSTVVNAALERINLASFNVGDNDALSELLNATWNRTELNLDSDDAHMAALVTGEAFVIVWKNEEDEIEAFYNDPRLVHVFYEPENPRRKQFAAKWWTDDDDHLHMTLYYADRLEYYATERTADNVHNERAFWPLGEITGNEADSVAENPYGRVPVFHFRRERTNILSELTDAIPLQNAVNKLMADMMVAAEFGAFKQRYIISGMDNLGSLRNAPNEIWDLPAGADGEQPTQVGELSPTELGNYLDAINQLAMSIGIITRTPKQYFFSSSTANISGEALIALETPLIKKVNRYIERFGAVWQDVAAFILLLLGQSIDDVDITPVFDRPETLQPYTSAQTREIDVRTGIPLVTVVERDGWTAAEIERMLAVKLEEESQRQTQLAGALLNAQRSFDQNANGLT